MMVINYLQTRQPPILPCLHQIYFDKFLHNSVSSPNSATKNVHDISKDSKLKPLSLIKSHISPTIIDGVDCSFQEDVSELNGFGSKNRDTLGALLFGFFRFYSHEFDYENQVLSVRRGKLLSKVEKGWNVDVERLCRFLCVEEPLTPDRNLANSADEVSVLGLRGEFIRALAILIGGGSLEILCEEYKIPHAHKTPRSSTSGSRHHHSNHIHIHNDAGDHNIVISPSVPQFFL